MKEILISSAFALNGTPNDFNAIIPQNTQEIKILEVSLPMSFNNIPDGSFIVNGSITGATTVTITGGRYTQTYLATLIQSLLVAAKPGMNYTVTVGLNNSFTFLATESFILNFTGSTLMPYLGFSGISSSANTHTGISTLSQFNPSHMLICSNNVFGIDNGVIFNQMPQGGILHAVPMCSSGTTNYRSDDTAPWVKLVYLFNPVKIEQNQTINFKLQLSNGLAVDMNGENWTIKLLLR